MNKPQKITIYDIAREAGVSIGTVSRVISETGYISLKTKNKVEKIIQKYNFSPNRTAQSMVKKNSNTIAVIVPDISNPFLSSFVGIIDRILSETGYSILLYNCEFSSDREEKAIDDILSRTTDGLILLSSGIDNDRLSAKLKNTIPTVAIGSNLKETDSIQVTDWQSSFEMTEHLIAQGHEKIACIGINAALDSIVDRIRGYKDALSKHGIPINEKYIYYIAHPVKNADQSPVSYAKKIFLSDDRPTAFFALNDDTAIDIYVTLEKEGFHPGIDFAVAGFDNISFSALLSPPLSTVSLPTQTMAETALDFLFKRIKTGNTSPYRQVHISGKLQIRESSTMYKF